MNRTCPRCEDLNPVDADFCQSCGYRTVVESSLVHLWGREVRQYRFHPDRAPA